MQTYHIHIRGRVQGVGFRPYAAKLAEARKLRGTVSNGMDGLHICLQTCETFAREYLDHLLAHPPAHSIITGYSIERSDMGDSSVEAGDRTGDTPTEKLSTGTHIQYPPGFVHPDQHARKIHDKKASWPNAAADRPYGLQILESNVSLEPDLLLTPDIALCEDCRKELTEAGNRRKGYAFTTCLHCGPRYSIVTALPYDRPRTTMAGLSMCPNCAKEYTDINDRRHFSQTNSCPDCAIRMHWYPSPPAEPGRADASDLDILIDLHAPAIEKPLSQEAIIPDLVSFLEEGKIVAVKGTGGYLLLGDATRPEVVQRLRERKHRPHKPFAVLYPSLDAAQQDLEIRPFEAEALQSSVAPIVLCKKLPHSFNFQNLQSNFISPALHRTGAFLPYTPLLQLIATGFNKPLIATSGNISGSPIVYQDEVALKDLWTVADAILTYDRDIMTPQDDSVWQFTDGGERIIIRRSRGMAPDYYPQGLGETRETILAMGADLKSSFAVHHRDKIYISQYLGDLEDYRAQEAWLRSQQHLLGLLKAESKVILSDLHPGYHSHTEAQRLAHEADIPLHAFQHHEAHFAAVLAENDLLNTEEPILGLVWDGTGYGEDGHSWGGESFVYERGRMDRVLQLEYFPQLLGDKMSREPRLSALSLMHHHFDAKKVLAEHFSDAEWAYYEKVLQQEKQVMTSSMGRLIDAVASILGVCQYNSYEGQAAMELEALAAGAAGDEGTPYPLTIAFNRINWRLLFYMILTDLGHGVPKAAIARRFFASLARLIPELAYRFDTPRVALSGGVFQNALLLELIRAKLPADIKLYTHQQLSPNDECIPLGQLALYHIKNYPLSRMSRDGSPIPYSLSPQT